MTTDDLTERIARVLHEHWVAEPGGGTATEAWTNCTCGIHITVPGGTRDEAWRRGDAHQAEQIAATVLPIVAEEVRKAKADAAKAAWDEAIEEALDGWTIPASGNIEAVRFILLSINPYMPEETL